MPDGQDITSPKQHMLNFLILDMDDKCKFPQFEVSVSPESVHFLSDCSTKFFRASGDTLLPFSLFSKCRKSQFPPSLQRRRPRRSRVRTKSGFWWNRSDVGHNK